MKNLGTALTLLVVTASPAVAGSITTPEPTTITLVATGAGVLGVAAWLRNRKKK